MKKSTAYMITDMLKGVIKSGSGTKAQIPDLYQAGKTGSVKYSDEEMAKYPAYAATPKDSWFVGYTRSYVVGIWTGYDNLKDGTIAGIGQYSAQLLYKSMMTYLMASKPNTNWVKPDSVVRAKIVKNSNPPQVAYGRSGTWELFVKGHTPAGIVDDASYDEDDEQTDTNSSQDTSVSSQSSSSSQASSNSSSSSSKERQSSSTQQSANKHSEANFSSQGQSNNNEENHSSSRN